MSHNPEQLADEIAASGLFDAAWYMEKYPDVALVGLSPIRHFVRFGLLLNRNPGPGFDSLRYIAVNGDVGEAGIAPLLHYIRFGKAEGRAALAAPLADLGAPLSDEYRMPPRPVRHDGARDIDPARRTVLLCAHSSDAQLFGGERSLLDVLHALAAMPVNLIVTLPSDGNQAYFEEVRASCAFIYTFGYRQWMENRDPYAWLMLDFADIIARHAVDIVHVNTIVLMEPAVAAKKMGRASVIHARELISLDGPLQQQMQQPASDIVDIVRDNGDWLIGNSSATSALFDKAGHSLCIPNAVAVDDLAMSNDFDRDIRFGIVSSNLPKKGLADFVEVARRVSSRTSRAKFVVVGPPTAQTEAWMQEVREGQRPDNLVFTGYKASPREAMQEINVLLNLSHFGESFGRTVAEAMAAARPVIAYRWGALPELVLDGETGYLAAFRDIDGVVDAVVRLCGEDAKIRTMGESGRAHIARNFSRERLGERMADAYDRFSMPSLLSAQTIGTPPPVTIVIPVFNALEEVRACIASVLKHTELGENELLVIDDASTDPGMAGMLASFQDHPALKIHRSPRNQGYTATVNMGIDMAPGRDVLLLNSDTVVTPRWLEGLRAAAYARPMIATVTAMSDNAGAFTFPQMERACPKPANMTHEEYALRMVQGTFDCAAPEVPTGSGFCLFIRRAAIDACGRFDVEAFPRGYGEENDFCMRLLNAGWTNLISPWSFVYHVRSASFKGEKESLSKAGMDVMNQRYPEYMSLVRTAFFGPVMNSLRSASEKARTVMAK